MYTDLVMLGNTHLCNTSHSTKKFKLLKFDFCTLTHRLNTNLVFYSTLKLTLYYLIKEAHDIHSITELDS